MPATVKSWVLLVALALAGCGGKPAATIDWSVGQRDGKATLTLNPGKSGATTLIFESLTVAWPTDQVKGSGTFQVADQEPGAATGQGQSKFDEVTISPSYAKGVATIRVNYCTFKIVDNGAKLEFANDKFSARDGKTIIVARDSTARVE
jgi:hypothetical protein